jgi:hypothetical protein
VSFSGLKFAVVIIHTPEIINNTTTQ